MDNFRLQGMGVAMITPFISIHQNAEIDTAALIALTEKLIAEGADFLTVLGTTAETATLSREERHLVLSTIRDTARSRVPLVVGVGGNCTATVCEELRTLPLDGYSAVLSVVPFYNKPTQEGIYRHYCAVADASPLPVILYNVPGRTGVNMTAQTTLRLAAHANIIGVKEASGNLTQIEHILRDKPEDFQVISGDDAITLPLMSMGASGVISVIGNAFPRQFAQMVHMAQSGDTEAAREIDHRLSEICTLLFADGNPGGIKCLLSLMDECHDLLRLPLVSVNDAVRANMRKALDRFRADK